MFTASVFIACTVDSGPSEKFDWLIGSWQRTNDEVPQQTYEYWTKVNDTLYMGHGCTLIDSDTIWQEFIRLEYDTPNWYFKVTKLNDTVSTDFRLDQIDRDEFLCYNPKNDFPTHISYKINGDNLNAVIGKDSTLIPFDFIRIK